MKYKVPQPRICRRCNKPFLAIAPQNFYCGSLEEKTGCIRAMRRIIWRRENAKRRTIATCVDCGGKFMKWKKQHIRCGSAFYKTGCAWKHRKKMNLMVTNRRMHRKRARGSYEFQDWLNLVSLYNNECPRCHKREPEIKLTIDHKIPLARGGTNDIDNLQPLCWRCNCVKGTAIMWSYCPLQSNSSIELLLIAPRTWKHLPQVKK